MSNWKRIQINTNGIETKTDKAVLIKCPNKSAYQGYMFWHPAKLVREGKHSHAASVSYTDEFEFRLRRYNKNKDVLSEKKINAQEFEALFGIVDDNISAPKQKDEFETHVPEEIKDTTEVQVDEGLRR